MNRTSIVIPTHNRAVMVCDTIRAALKCEGHEAREVIVVNDGSTDGTAETLKGFGDAIQVIHSQHGERSRARNAGIEAASGEFVYFCDDDDALLANGLSALEAHLSRASEEVGAVYGRPRYVRIDPNNPLRGDIVPGIGTTGRVMAQLLRANFIQMGTIMVRRSVLQTLGGFDPLCPPLEDYDLWIRLATNWRIEFVDVEVAEIRLHATNSTCDTALAGKMTETVRQKHLLSEKCRRSAGSIDGTQGRKMRQELASLCLEMARRRWWEGAMDESRQAHAQAVRFSPAAALIGTGVLWRAWLPVRRPRWLRK